MAITHVDATNNTVTLAEMVQRGAYDAVSGIEGIVNRLTDWFDRRAAAARLARMPDYLLRDVGVARADIEDAVGL